MCLFFIGICCVRLSIDQNTFKFSPVHIMFKEDMIHVDVWSIYKVTKVTALHYLSIW